MASVSVNVPWIGQVFSIDDLAVALDDVRLDLADVLVDQRLDRLLAGQDPLPRFLDAGRAQRIGRARPAERRLGALVALQERRRRPLGLEGAGLEPTIDGLKCGPGETRGAGKHRFDGTPDVDASQGRHPRSAGRLPRKKPAESPEITHDFGAKLYHAAGAAPARRHSGNALIRSAATSASSACRLTLPRSSRGSSREEHEHARNLVSGQPHRRRRPAARPPRGCRRAAPHMPRSARHAAHRACRRRARRRPAGASRRTPSTSSGWTLRPATFTNAETRPFSRSRPSAPMRAQVAGEEAAADEGRVVGAGRVAARHRRPCHVNPAGARQSRPSSGQNASVTPGTGRPIVTSPSGSGSVS